MNRDEAFKKYLDELHPSYVCFLIAKDERMELEKKKFDIMWDLMPEIYTTKEKNDERSSKSVECKAK